MARARDDLFDVSAELEADVEEQDLASIREQYLRLDADEKKVLRRILRQAEQLDEALADLHLVLPALEFCFYGLPNGSSIPTHIHPRAFRALLREWSEVKTHQK